MLLESIIAKKSLGVLMHPSCIPGGRVCGTFGSGAKEWIKKLHKHGIEYWQFLPLHQLTLQVPHIVPHLVLL